MLGPMCIMHVYGESHMTPQLTSIHLTLDYIFMSNQGHTNITFKKSYIVNGASYDQSLFEMHMLGRRLPFCVPLDIERLNQRH